MYYQGEAVRRDVMGMEEHTTITVHEDTHLALKRICKVYGYDSIHQFVLQQALKEDEQGDGNAIPTGLQLALEKKSTNSEHEHRSSH